MGLEADQRIIFPECKKLDKASEYKAQKNLIRALAKVEGVDIDVVLKAEENEREEQDRAEAVRKGVRIRYWTIKI